MKLVLMCTYLMLAIYVFVEEADEQRVFMKETQVKKEVRAVRWR